VPQREEEEKERAATTIAKEYRRWSSQRAFRLQRLEKLAAKRREARLVQAPAPDLPPAPALVPAPAAVSSGEGSPEDTELPPGGKPKKQPFLRRRSVARRVHQKLDFSAVKPLVECRLSRRTPMERSVAEEQARPRPRPPGADEVPVATAKASRVMVGRADSDYAGSGDLNREVHPSFAGQASLEETMEHVLEHATAPPFQGLVKKWYRRVAKDQDSQGLRLSEGAGAAGSPFASGPGGARGGLDGGSRVAALDLRGLKALGTRLRAGAS
jgi:hypothetical protein